MYRQVKDMTGNVNPDIVQRIADSAFIPADPANRDYQDYLAWVAEGNEAEPWA